MKNPSPSVVILIAVNVLFFVATYMVPQQEARMLDLFALHFPQNEKIRIWQFVSHMFMHGSPAHILLNMFALYSFGSPLEMMWGARRFLTFYFVAGIGAGLIYTGVNLYEFDSVQNTLVTSGLSADQIFHSTVVGASGAIYGVLVAFAILFPNAKLFLLFIPVPIAAKYIVPGLLLFDLFSGVTGISLFGGGIAHFAHIGGALIGFSLMMYWRKTLPRRYSERRM